MTVSQTASTSVVSCSPHTVASGSAPNLDSWSAHIPASRPQPSSASGPSISTYYESSPVMKTHKESQRKIILACNSLVNHRVNPIFHALQIFISILYLHQLHIYYRNFILGFKRSRINKLF